VGRVTQPAADTPLASLLSLAGKRAIVTGGGQGFGFACAARLAEAGATVVIGDRAGERAERAAKRLRARSLAVVAVEADIADPDDVTRLVATAADELGGVDVLVNNAGVFSNYLLPALRPDELRRLLSVNVEGTYLCTRACVERMVRQGSGGSVISITSIDAVHPTSVGMSHYTATKHAVWGLTKSLALELGPQGIRVNAIAPGPSLTEGAVEYIEAGSPEGIDVQAQWARAAERVPLRRWADPDEIGRVCVFLASDLASYVHGAQIVVDGGYLVA
jgi:2-deoxy-D-gluconate 3-dehydrogenase